MRKKTFLILLIVFITVGLIGYFITQPQIQAQDAPAGPDVAITGSIFYSGADCQYREGDQVIVGKWNTNGGVDWVAWGQVQYFGGGYFWSVSADELENQAGNYRLIPDLQNANGVSPQVRDPVYWQPGTVTFGQHFTAVSCDHP